MRVTEISLVCLSCDEKKINKSDVNFWKRRLLARKAIPSPWVNKEKQIVAFHNCFFGAQGTPAFFRLFCSGLTG
jgi:hypothetical protein